MSTQPIKEKQSPEIPVLLDKKEAFKEIAERIDFARPFLGTERKRRIALKVMDLYFEMLFQELFNGKQVHVPSLGNIALHYSPTISPNRIPYVKKGLDRKIITETGNRKFNHKTLTNFAAFKFDGSGLITGGIKFRACRAQRRKLRNLLVNTDFVNTIESWQ